MTTIAIPRALLEQALESMCWAARTLDIDPDEAQNYHRSLENIRAALSAPATAPDEVERLRKDAERKPMTDKDIAGAIVRSPDPVAFGRLPAEGWRPMVRLVEAFHGIKGTP